MVNDDGQDLRVRHPRLDDAEAFLAAVRRSRDLHHPWVAPPADPAAYETYVKRSKHPSQASYIAWLDGEPVAVVNLNGIVRGAFQSGDAGYYAFEPHAGTGLTRRVLARVLDEAFGTLDLHRIEANVQPANERSKTLVKSLGFRYEGYSPGFLHLFGAWRDHERWAILSDEWRRP